MMNKARILTAPALATVLGLGAISCSQSGPEASSSGTTLPNVEVHAAYPVVASSPADLLRVSDVVLVRRKGAERLIGKPEKRLSADPRAPLVEHYEQDFEVVRSFSEKVKAGSQIRVGRTWRNYTGVANVVHTDDVPPWVDQVYILGLHDVDGAGERFIPVGGPNGIIAFGGYADKPIQDQTGSLTAKGLPLVDDSVILRGRNGKSLSAVLQEFESRSTQTAPPPSHEDSHESTPPTTVATSR